MESHGAWMMRAVGSVMHAVACGGRIKEVTGAKRTRLGLQSEISNDDVV
jgi:hypothetical protein